MVGATRNGRGNVSYRPVDTYRVRARDARIRVMRRITPTGFYKNEVVEPRTIAIITRKVSRSLYRLTR
jgi:hypothetical protein